MKKRKKLGRKLLSFLLTLAMVIGLVPEMGMTVYAAPPSSDTGGMVVGGVDIGVTEGYASIKNTTTAVTFDNKEWYLIDYDSSTVTLLSKECVGASAYNSSGSYVEYSNSTVKAAVDSWYSTSISENGQAALNGTGAFLLTTDQAETIKNTNSDVLKCSQATGAVENFWWLCSPSSINDSNAACVGGADTAVYGGGSTVDKVFGVRPALQLNLESVIYDSNTNTFSLKPVVTEYPLWVGGTQVTSANASNITGSNPVTASYDASTYTLTLNNYSYSGEGHSYASIHSAGIYGSFETLIINLIGSNTITNTLTATYADGVFCSNNIKITGNGSLTCSRAQGTTSGYGIYCNELTIEGATINLQAPNDNGGGVQTNRVVLNSGALTSTGGYNGIIKNNSYKNLIVEINDGSFIVSGNNTAIYDGTVKNKIAGTGWTDAAGTEGQADIAISTDGQSLNSYRKVQFPAAAVSHIHDEITFDAWESNDSLPTEAGSYYLSGDVTIQNNWEVSKSVSLCLNGHKISISGNSDIYINDGGILNLYDDEGDGEITGSGREAVLIGGNGQLNMYGGKISNNKMGVYINSDGVLTMSGGSILNNTDRGVVVYGTFNVSGTPTIKDNTIANVYVPDNKKISITNELNEGASIGVSMETPGVFTSGWKTTMNDKDPSTYFTADDSSSSIIMDGDEAKLNSPPGASIEKDGVVTEYPTFAKALEKWSGGSTLKLLKDVEIASYSNVNKVDSGEYTLDLNGYGILYSGGYNSYAGGVIHIGNSYNSYKTKLIMKDSRPDAVHYVILDDKGRGIEVSETAPEGTASIKVSGGYITGGQGGGDASRAGGGVYVDKSGEFTMNGGTIVGNQFNHGYSACGGGVFVYSGGTFTMNGGTITANTVRCTTNYSSNPGGCGGGVYVGEGSKFVMTGGQITDNHATNYGGGIYVNGGTYNASYPSSNKNPAVIEISGSAVIKDNTDTAESPTASNVYLKNGKGSGGSAYDAKINLVGSLANNASIGVTMETPGVFTSGSTDEFKASDYQNRFSSDDNTYKVLTDGNELKLGTHEHSFTYTADGATITATCNADDCPLSEKKVTLTIIAPTLTTYSGTGDAAASLDGRDAFNTATGKNITVSDIKYSGRGGTSHDESTAAPVTPGKYTASITLSGVNTSEGEGESVSASVDYEITKADQSVNPPTANTDLKYDKTSHKLIDSPATVATGNMSGEVQYSLDNGTSWYAFETIPQQTNAGTYTVLYKVPGNDEYNEFSASIEVVIAKAQQEVTAPVGKTDLIYNGYEQNLLTGRPIVLNGNTQASIEFKVDNGAWMSSLPTAVNAGGHTVYYRVPENNNYEIYEGSIRATIAKADPAEPTGLTATYGQTLADVTLPEGWTWSDSTTDVGVAGTHSFKANCNPTDTDNYNTLSNVDLSVTVSPVDPIANAPTGLTATYGQTLGDLTLTNPDGNTPGTWEFVDAGTTSVGNAGEHTFQVKFTPTDAVNYNTLSNVDVTVTVGKADQTAPAAPTKAGATTNSITLTAVAGCEYRMGTDGTWQEAPTFTGLTINTEYTFYQRLKEDANHNASPASQSSTISTNNHVHEWSYAAGTGENANTITATCADSDGGHGETKTARITVVKPEKTTYGDSGSPNATIEGSIDGVTNPVIVYKKGTEELTSAPTEAGTYTASITLGGANATVDYIIARKQVTVSGITADDKTYDGNTTATLVTTAAIFDGKLSGDALTVSATGTFENANAGENKAVTISGLTLGGTDKDNYVLAVEGQQTGTTATITAKEVGLEWSNTELTYNGLTQAPTATATGLVSGDTCTVTVSGEQTNVGNNYTATASSLSNSNYKLPENKTTTFKISRANAIAATVIANNRTYDGMEQPLVTVTGETTGGTLKFAVTTENQEPNSEAYTFDITSIPTKTNAGTYYVWYKVLGDDNHNDLTATKCEVEIAKKVLSITADSATKAYDTTALTKNSYTNTDLATGDGIESVTINGTQTAVGNSTNVPSNAVIKKGGTDVTANYEITYVNGTLTVTQATTNTVTVEITGWTYGDSANAPTSGADFGANTVTYSYSDAQDGTYTATVPVNAGTWYVKASVAGTDNYVAGEAVTSFAINKKALTITAKNDERAFTGQPLTNNGYDKTELAAGDNLESVTVTGSQTEVGSSANVPSVAVIKKGETDVTANYEIAYVNGTLTIVKANANIVTVGLQGWTYGEMAKTPIATANFGENTVTYSYSDAQNGTYTATVPVNAGTWYVKASVAGTANYVGGEAVTSFTIAKKALTITADSATKVYDTTALTKNTYTCTDLATGDGIESVTITGTQTTAGKCANVPSSAVIKNGGTDVTANYEITYVDGTLTVAQATTNTVTVDIMGWTYGESANAPTSEASFGANTVTYSYSDAQDGTYTATVPVNAGTWYVKASVVGTADYVAGEAVKSFTIAKKALTITADSATKVYDTTALTKNSYTNTALATGDSIESVTITGSQTTAASSANVPSAAVIKKSGTDVTANYQITYENGTLTVTKATTNTVTVDITGWTYGESANAPTSGADFGANTVTYSYSDAQDGTYTATVPVNAGTWYVKASVAGTENYVAGEATKSFTIAKKALTITADSATKVYDTTALTKNTYTNTALATGDSIENVTITGSQTTVASSANVPSSAVIKKSGTDVTANYQITYENGTLTVTKATTNTVTVDITGWTYGESANAPTSGADFGANTVTYSYSDAQDGTYTAEVPVNAGTWYVKASVAGTENYVAGEATKSFTIAKKALTITADSATKVYDTTALTKNSYTNTALAAGDSIESVTITGSQTTAASSANVPSSAVIKKSGTDVTANYQITYVNGTLTVTQATTNTVTVEITGWTYGDSANAPTSEASFGANTVTYSYSDAQDGTYTATVPVNAGTWYVKASVAGTENYVAGEAVKSFTIAKREVVISGIVAVDKNYDETTNAPLDFSKVSIANLVAADAGKLSVTATGSFADEKIGKDKKVTISDLALSGDAAGNYVLAAEGQQTESKADISNMTAEADGSFVARVEDFNLNIKKVEGLDLELGKALCTPAELALYEAGAKIELDLEIRVAEGLMTDDVVSKVTGILWNQEHVTMHGAKYFDITLYKKVGDANPVKVTDLGDKSITIKMGVPEDMKNKDEDKTRTFFMVRMHSGEAAVLTRTPNEELVFNTNLFSTYAICFNDAPAWKPAPKTAATTGSGSTAAAVAPKTSGTDETARTLLVFGTAFAVAAIVSRIYVLGRRKEEEE